MFKRMLKFDDVTKLLYPLLILFCYMRYFLKFQLTPESWLVVHGLDKYFLRVVSAYFIIDPIIFFIIVRLILVIVEDLRKKA